MADELPPSCERIRTRAGARFRWFCRLLLVTGIGLSSPLMAHDPPEEYYGRNITITLEPGYVRIQYRMELSQVSLFNLPRLDDRIQIGGAKGRAALEAACMERFKALIPDRLLAFLNDKPLNWSVEKARVNSDPKDSTHFELDLRADWTPKTGVNKFEISDDNFADAPGPYRLSTVLGHEVKAEEVNDPREWSGKGISPAECRKASSEFSIAAALQRSAAPPPAIEELPSNPEPAPKSKSIWERLHDDDLIALLDTNYGIGLLLLLALIHGAGHSLMPGHGKTMVAAYLVGERGTPWHAVLLGIVTTLTHTSAAFVVAALLWYVLPPESKQRVNTVLQFSCGLLMAGIGLWLFLQRLAGRSDHVHLFDVGHGHSHGDTPPSIGKGGFVRLVLLGIAGGLIPCWGAIMWVIGCIATGQFELALPIVLAFSVGLASVLIAIGLSVVYAGRVGKSRWSRRRWFERLFNERTIRWLPVFGAATVTAIGLFLCATSGIAAR